MSCVSVPLLIRSGRGDRTNQHDAKRQRERGDAAAGDVRAWCRRCRDAERARTERYERQPRDELEEKEMSRVELDGRIAGKVQHR